MRGTITRTIILVVYVFFSFVLDFTNGRLTEFATNRLPVLAHNLHTAKIDLKILSKRALLGPRSEFQFKTGDFYRTAKGSQRVRLVQTYAGYEVYGPTAVAELDMGGHFTGHLYGEVARDLHKDIPNPEACVKNISVLLNRATRLKKINLNDPNIDNKDGRRVIYADPNKPRARIVYIVDFFYTGHNFVSLPVYYFDACSNSLMFSYNDVRNMSISYAHNKSRKENIKLHSHASSKSLKFSTDLLNRTKLEAGCDPSAVGRGGNRKTGRTYYNSPPFCLPVDRKVVTCTMNGDYVKVVNNRKSTDLKKTTVASFACNRGYKDDVNGAYGVANDALFFGELTGKFFDAFFGQRALPSKTRIVVHYGKDYENAFWTGSSMFFGDGKDIFYPLVSLDIIAHELAHGITRKNSDLVYKGQSGGINEAFSDISGMAVEEYIYGKASWKIGSTVLKDRNRALRYLYDPPKDGRSIKYAILYRPGMDVHFSSGVFNYAFYKMSLSLRLKFHEAYASFFIANKLLWGRLTRFRSGACNVVQASYDAGTSFRIVRRAFRSTGIPLIICRPRLLKTTLFPGETRENILVSNTRSPIFEIDMTQFPGSGAKASIETDDIFNDIRIVLATDGDADNVIDKGINHVKFPGNRTILHVKLMSSHKMDIKVTLKILN